MVSAGNSGGLPAPDDAGRTSSGGERGDVLARRTMDAAVLDHAFLGVENAGHRLQQRRLAGTVGAEQGDDAAFGHLQLTSRTASMAWS